MTASFTSSYHLKQEPEFVALSGAVQEALSLPTRAALYRYLVNKEAKALGIDPTRLGQLLAEPFDEEAELFDDEGEAEPFDDEGEAELFDDEEEGEEDPLAYLMPQVRPTSPSYRRRLQVVYAALLPVFGQEKLSRYLFETVNGALIRGASYAGWYAPALPGQEERYYKQSLPPSLLWEEILFTLESSVCPFFSFRDSNDLSATRHSLDE